MAKTSKANQKNTSYSNSSVKNNSNSGGSGDHAITKGKRKRKAVVPRDSPPQRSSIYRGVTRHRWTGRYEAHLWDKNCWNETQSKKGRQVYLGAYDDEEAAAHAYDLAALKYWGQDTILNFPLSTYEKELKEMEDQSREEYIGSLRRKSSGFSRGVSRYRGVARRPYTRHHLAKKKSFRRHHHNGRWEARIGRVFGNKYLYLGTYATQEEAAMAYDMAAIEHRGPNAVTNFDLSRYIKCNPQPKPNPNSSDLNPIPNTKEEIDFSFINQQHEQQQSSKSAGTTVPPPHPVGGTASSSAVDFPETPPEPDRLRRSFPDDIQTYFDCQDSSSFVEEHDIIFGDLDSFLLPMFTYELNT